jgi:hypothetical protein
MYLVVEWTTASAPSASGCWRYGDANVLSTTSSAPPQQRVGRRFDPHEPDLAIGERGLHRGCILHRHRPVGDAPAGQHLVEQPERAAISVVRDQDVISRLADGTEQAVRRSHARREHQAARTALQRDQALLERAPGGVVGA